MARRQTRNADGLCDLVDQVIPVGFVDGDVITHAQGMVAQLVDGLIGPFMLFIIMEEPVCAPMSQPAIGALVLIGRETDDRAALLVIPPQIRIQKAILVQGGRNYIALRIIAFRKTGIGIAAKPQR